MKMIARHGWFLTFAVLLALPGCGGKTGADGKDGKNGSGTAVDHSSPEKVAESFKKAAGDKDWKTMFACMTKESKSMLMGGLMLGAAFSTFGDKSKKESLNKLMEKHGIDPKKKGGPGEDLTKAVKDLPALFGDLMDWIDKNAKRKEGRKSMVEQFASTEISNFKIKDDTATAEVSVDGKKKSRPAEFKKIDGKWYFDLAGSSRRKRKSSAPPFPK